MANSGKSTEINDKYYVIDKMMADYSSLFSQYLSPSEMAQNSLAITGRFNRNIHFENMITL